jgi:FlaA1/EpsC-like NDP-sugar epimerase
MTRFFLSLDKAVHLVWKALDEGLGGEIFVRKCPSMKITDLATAIAPSAKQEIMGIRPGEKLHELMISEEDAAHTVEFDDHYKIVPEIINRFRVNDYKAGGKPCAAGFCYTSGNNTEWMSVAEMQAWLKQEYSYEAV